MHAVEDDRARKFLGLNGEGEAVIRLLRMKTLQERL